MVKTKGNGIVFHNKLRLIGYASGTAGRDLHCCEGPMVIQQSSYLSSLKKTNLSLDWSMILPPSSSLLRKDELVSLLCKEVAKKASIYTKEKFFFTVIGGDHSCAIGTWSGVYDALHHAGEIGLIWIDAHMDSHTPETTKSGQIHGMPLAALLGYGYESLTLLLHEAPKIKPENICLIGVRSFERGEAELLKRLCVHTYFMEEVKQRGCVAILKEAVNKVSQKTVGFGISIDLDALDPEEIPGVDAREPHGISTTDLYEGIAQIISDPRLIAMEIAEFNPSRDEEHRTEKFIISFLEMIASKKYYKRSDY